MFTEILNNLLIRLLNFLRLKLGFGSNNSLIVKYLQALYRTYIKKRYLPKIISLPFPCLDGEVMISLTYECQCGCPHCCVAFYKQAQKGLLNSQEVMRLVDESRRLGVSLIYFMGGEPLLVSNLPEYIRYAKNKGLITSLDTNGLLLNEDMVKRLKGAGLDVIGVSIDSPFETVHDVLRGVNGIFKRAITGIKLCRRYNIECYICTYATKENLKNGELEKIINLAKSLNVKVWILSPITSGRWLNREDLILSQEEIDLLRNYLERRAVVWEDGHIDSKEIPFSCAAFKRERFYVSAYGDVQPCPLIPISFGNIREEPLKSILKKMWNSEMFGNHRGYYDCPMNDKNFRQKHIKLCSPVHSI